MEFCEYCGVRLDYDAAFCSFCGKDVDKTGAHNPYAPPKENTPVFEIHKSPLQYFTGAFKKYAVFQGRARRAEFWWFTLFEVIFSVVSSIVDSVLELHIFGEYGIFQLIFILAVFIPSLSLTARRMHDCDKSGWYMLIPIYSFIICCTKGTPGDNSFGPDPIVGNNMGETK